MTNAKLTGRMFIGQFKDPQVRKDGRVQRGRQDCKDQSGRLVLKVRPVRKGQLGRWDCREWEYKGRPGRKDHRALWDHKALRVNLDWTASKVFKGLKVFRAHKVNLGHQDRQATVAP